MPMEIQGRGGGHVIQGAGGGVKAALQEGAGGHDLGAARLCSNVSISFFATVIATLTIY